MSNEEVAKNESKNESKPSRKEHQLNRRLFGALLAASAFTFALPSAHAAPQDHGHGNGHGHDDDDDHGKGHGKDHDHEEHYEEHGNGHNWNKNERYYHDEDRVYLTRYYDGPRDLPPGLRKKYYRNGTLPPGWEKRFRPLPPQVIVQLPAVPVGYERGYCDGYAVIVDPRTRIIYDAIDIVGALTTR
jgi:hypothetical protein